MAITHDNVEKLRVSWGLDNDGSGSGLDADTIDGIDSTNLYQIKIFSGDIDLVNTAGSYKPSGATNYPGARSQFMLNVSVSGGFVHQHLVNDKTQFQRRSTDSGGTWGTWVETLTSTSTSGPFVLKTGDTMTGNLTVNADLMSDHLQFQRSYQLPNGVDLDTVDGITYPSGFYDCDAATSANTPHASWIYLEVQRHTNTNGYCKQIVTQLNNSDKRWYRIQNNDTWGAWREILTDNSASGPFVLKTGDTITGDLSLQNSFIQMDANENDFKYKIWGSAAKFGIGMSNTFHYGSVLGHSNTFTMGTDDTQGWLWRRSDHANGDASMSLSCSGILTVKTVDVKTRSYNNYYDYGDSVSGSTTINFGLRNNFRMKLNGNVSLANPTNVVTGQSGSILIIKNGHSITSFGTSWKKDIDSPSVDDGSNVLVSYYTHSSTYIVYSVTRIA